MTEIDRMTKLAGIKSPVSEKVELNASDKSTEHHRAKADDVTKAMKMAKLKKTVEDNDDGDVNFNGLFTGVAKGTISLNDKGKIAESNFGFIKSLEENSNKKIKTNESSEEKKEGRKVAGSWGRPGSKPQKRAASKSSRKVGKNEIKKQSSNESMMFQKGSLDRIMVEMIMSEMKSGKNAKEISEELSFSLEHVEPIFNHLKKKVSEGYKVVSPIDNEKYPERPGLEGPYRADSGLIYYYDAKEGKHYDPSTDMYISIDDLKSHGVQENNLPGYDAWKTASPYDNEPSDQEIDQAYEYANDYGMDFLNNDKMAQAAIFDIKNPRTDPEDREAMISDLASDVKGIITRNLENDDMLFLDENEIKNIAVKILSKYLSM